MISVNETAEIEINRRVPLPENNLRIGVFVCDCGSNIAGTVDTEAVKEYAAGLSGVTAAIRNKYTCADPGQKEIQQAIADHNLNRVVVASCSPISYEVIFRKCIEDAGLNPYLLEMANIREHCSWVTPGDKEAATEKAKKTVKVAVARSRWLIPEDEEQIQMTDAALVIGAGVAGIQAALDLADSGHQVYLVEKDPSIGGIMAQLDKVYPDIECSI